MKLIHCADIHLDSPMESNLSSEKARERKNEIRATFARMVREAENSGVDAILIAGDLFDGERVTKSTATYVLELIRSVPAIDFYYLAGNHDRGSAIKCDATRPDNLYTFEDTWTSYTLCQGVTLTGSERPNPDTLSLDAGNVNLVMLHGQEKSGKGAAREDVIHFGKYKKRGIDYMALGHIHEYRTAPIDQRGIACYSGCLEGRGFDECGEKGYVLIEIHNGKLTHTFVPFATRRLHEVKCDISDAVSAWELEGCVRKATEGIDCEDMVKVILVGKTLPDAQKDVEHLRQVLSERFYFAKIRDESGIVIRPEEYQNDISLKGEFVRRVLASDLEESEKERIIACGLRVLSGEEVGL